MLDEPRPSPAFCRRLPPSAAFFPTFARPFPYPPSPPLTPSHRLGAGCYDAATVYDAGMAKHYETGEPLPEEFYEKLKGSKETIAKLKAVGGCGGAPPPEA